MQKVAVLLYVYHPHKWYIIRRLLLQIKNNIDVFLAVCEDIDCTEILRDCKQTFNTQEIIVVKNKGLDLEPFLRQIETLNSKKYPIFLKLHTKQSLLNDCFDWSVCLLNSTIGTKSIFTQNIQLLNDSKIGALCDYNFIVSNNERTHRTHIEHLCKIIDINYSDVQLGRFMVGSIFFGKTHIFKSIYKPHKSKQIISLLEEGIISKQIPSSYTHALECVMGYALTYNGYRIEGCYFHAEKIYNTQLNKTLNLIITYCNTCYIKENPLMHGEVTNKSNKSLTIIWSHCDDKEYEYVREKNYFIRKEHVVDSQFNPLEYKRLNADLLQLSDSEAAEHFELYGKNSGRVESIEKIKKCFNKSFYTKEYDVNEERAFENYIEKGRIDGRLFAPEILQNSFDYGFYISYKNHFKNNKCFNMYDAFLENDKRYFNNIIKFNVNDVLLSTCCVYVANIDTKRDVYYALNDLQEITKYCKNTIIISNKHLKGYKCTKLIGNVSTQLWYLQAIETAINNIKTNNKNFIILTNKSFIINDIKPTLLKLQNSNRDFTSLTDCYTGVNNKNLACYCLQSEMLHFKQDELNTYKNFISNFIKKNKNKIINEPHIADTLYEFELTKFLIKNKKTIGSLLTPTHELELLWKDLLSVQLNLQPDILHRYNIPVINKKNLNYFTQLIPQKYKKTKGTFKIKNFYTSYKLSRKTRKSVCVIVHVYHKGRVSEFDQYIKRINKVCDATFIITGDKDIFNELNKDNIKIQYLECENKGMDIGPFIKTMDVLYKTGIEYDFIVKLQDKCTTSWRKHCINNIINNLTHYIDIIQANDSDVAGPYGMLSRLDNINLDTVTNFIKRYNIPFNYENEQQSNAFIAGTMFIIKHKCFNNFIKKYKIDLKYEYEMLEQGKVTNMYATNTHAWERIFTCVIPTVMQTKVKCI